MKDLRRLEEIWAAYVYEGRLDSSVQPAVAECWRKCREAGVDPNGGIGRRVDDAVFRSIREANSTLMEIALPIMQSVFDIVRRTGFLMVLTDSAGYVLETMGDESIMERTEDLRFVPGALWSNLSVGTNAISVALDCDTPIQMVGPEHYCRTHHSWTCSAAPIHGINGEVIGCFNMSGDASGVHDHTLAVVLAAVYGIEGKLSLLHNAEIMRAALEGSADGIVLLGQDDYRAIWMNSAAGRLLGLSLEELKGRDFRRLMPDIGWDAMDWRRGSRCFSDDTRLISGDDLLHCSASVSPSMDYDVRTLCVTLKKQKHLLDSVNKVSGNRAIYTFQDIYTRDPAMKKTIALARRYAQYDGNILIEGESGTGKELFAQSMHNEGSRSEGPFVAINCASIPRDLLERELFGYEAGTFPGAHSGEGNPGRFELANHGTLFLDEIGELPIEFQSKLLRAVETHRITRVGGSQEIDLDIRIIASTNRKLEQLAVEGGVRQDLYFRLNVLKLEIPPLRERPGDIGLCAGHFLERLNKMSPEPERSMAPEFLSGLMEYDWPGNVRELQNTIERAYYSTTGALLDAQSLRLSLCPSSKPPAEPASEAGELLSALTLSGGSVEDAARRLGMSRATLYRKIKRCGIDVKSMR